MIVELSAEHAIGLKPLLPAKDVLLIQGLKKAVVKLHTTPAEIIIIDLGTHGGPNQNPSPVEACRQLAAAAPTAKLIAVGAADDFLAEQLLMPNVYDILAYPSETQALHYAVERAQRLVRIQRRSLANIRHRPFIELIPGVMSSDTTMRRIIKRCQRLVGHNVRILVQGEPGTGRKTLARYFARAVPGQQHKNSKTEFEQSIQEQHAPLPYLLNCSRHTQGTEIEAMFRQAMANDDGIHQPVVVLENIEQLDPATQTELLYLIHNSENRWRDVNTLPQIISLAGPTLGAKIVDGQFRRDLYDRLGQVHLCLPPLRQRGDDLRELAQWFLDKHRQPSEHPHRQVLSDEALRTILRHPWHGNITELENIMQQAAITAEGVHIQTTDLGLSFEESAQPITLRQARDEAERSAIVAAMKHANGSIAKAASALAISRPTLYDLLAKHQIR